MMIDDDDDDDAITDGVECRWVMECVCWCDT